MVSRLRDSGFLRDPNDPKRSGLNLVQFDLTVLGIEVTREKKV